MDILKLAHRLVGAHHYISAEDTGTPVEFAAKLGIAESHLYQLLDVLRGSIHGTVSTIFSRKQELHLPFRLGILSEQGWRGNGATCIPLLR